MFRIAKLLLLATCIVLGSSCVDLNTRVIEDCYGDAEVNVEYIIPIVVHKPKSLEPTSGAPIVHDRVDDMIEAANLYLGDFNISVKRVETVYEDYDVNIVTDTRKGILDRKVLVEHNEEYWDDGRLHVYVVRRVWDHDNASSYGGFFYHEAGKRCTGVIGVKVSGTPVKILAHEIGHVLGLAHIEDSTNMMFPRDLGEAAGFDADQGEKMRDKAELRLCDCWT